MQGSVDETSHSLYVERERRVQRECYKVVVFQRCYEATRSAYIKVCLVSR
jgi:hypothetical protein